MSVSIEEGGTLYRIHENGEWARIFVKAWENSTAYDKALNYGVMVMCHSSYGNYAHSWTSCGEPHTKFLPDLDFSYLMGKFAPDELREFDGEATKAYLLTMCLNSRKDTYLTKEEARKAYDHIESISADNPDQLMMEWRDCSMETQRLLNKVTEEPYEYIVHRPSHQAKGFYDRIWTPFVKFLKEQA